MPKRSRQVSRAQRKLAEVQRQQRRRQMQIRTWIGAAVLAVVAAVVLVVVLTVGGGTTAATNTGTGATHAATGASVDGISCQTSEQVAYHIHAHLAIFDNGKQQTLPRGIGIPNPQVQNGFVVSGKCFYWLHTHDTTGVIHVESPTQRSYTLGQFFDIWGQPLNGSQVGSAHGKLTVFVDGHQFSGDPRSIVLTPHKLIQLDVGTVVSPKPFTFPAGL
jgi:hypothetical protein